MKEIFDWSNLRKWYVDEELSYFEIAERIGCKWRAVFHALKRQGIKTRGQQVTMAMQALKQFTPYKEEISRRLQQKDYPSDIADSLGMSVPTLRRAIRILGLTYPKLSGYTREKTSNWKGGYKSYHGYIRIRMPEHPFAASDGYVPQHRLVMEQHLGRYLLPSEVVHHKDGNRSNNVIENLELISIANHRLRTEFCKNCILREEIRRLKRQLQKAEINCQLMLNSTQPNHEI